MTATLPGLTLPQELLREIDEAAAETSLSWEDLIRASSARFWIKSGGGEISNAMAKSACASRECAPSRKKEHARDRGGRSVWFRETVDNAPGIGRRS